MLLIIAMMTVWEYSLISKLSICCKAIVNPSPNKLGPDLIKISYLTMHRAYAMEKNEAPFPFVSIFIAL